MGIFSKDIFAPTIAVPVANNPIINVYELRM